MSCSWSVSSSSFDGVWLRSGPICLRLPFLLCVGAISPYRFRLCQQWSVVSMSAYRQSWTGNCLRIIIAIWKRGLGYCVTLTPHEWTSCCLTVTETNVPIWLAVYIYLFNMDTHLGTRHIVTHARLLLAKTFKVPPTWVLLSQTEWGMTVLLVGTFEQPMILTKVLSMATHTHRTQEGILSGVTKFPKQITVRARVDGTLTWINNRWNCRSIALQPFSPSSLSMSMLWHIRVRRNFSTLARSRAATHTHTHTHTDWKR